MAISESWEESVTWHTCAMVVLIIHQIHSIDVEVVIVKLFKICYISIIRVKTLK